jgi:hypothetical protein
MTGWFYRKYPLRDQDHSDLWTYRSGAFHLWTHGPTKSTWQRRTDLISEVAPASNTWLSWSAEDLAAYAERFALTPDKAFEFSISKNQRGSKPVALTIDWRFGFRR